MLFLSLQFAGYFSTGLMAGVIAGMFGVGGGILIVPALLFLFHVDGINPVISMQLAVGTSLATIIFTNAFATWGHYQHNSVHWRMVWRYTPGVLLGAGLGVQLAAHVMDGKTLRMLFGLFEIAVGWYMVRGGRPPVKDSVRPPASSGFFASFAPTTHTFLAIIIGTLSTLFGIGGGTMLVPALTIMAGLPIRQAIGSASAMGGILAVVGTTGLVHAGWGCNALPVNTLGFVVPQAALGIVLGTSLSTSLGVKLAHSMDPHFLKRGFGFLLLLVGMKLLLMS